MSNVGRIIRGGASFEVNYTLDRVRSLVDIKHILSGKRETIPALWIGEGIRLELEDGSKLEIKINSYMIVTNIVHVSGSIIE
jgi:hypothetical protein